MFTEEELAQVKVKKLATLLDKGSRQVTGKIQEFIANTNKDLALYKTRVDGMYNHLMRTFLVSLEKRLYACEVISKASLEVMYVRFYELEKLKDPSFEMAYTEYVTRTNELVQAHIDRINATENLAIKKEEETENVAPV
jgi:hypothetical protein